MNPRKKDVRIDKLVDWNDFASLPAERSLPAIYDHAKCVSERAREWYWRNIDRKRRWSVAVRSISFTLLVAGAVLPVCAGLMSDAQARLNSTQWGVVALAVAGLLQAADRIFGWSSGWLRYISTVTNMENVTRRFELEWSNHLINKAGPVGEEDKPRLFEMAKRMEEDISKLQSDETEKWVAEFNTSLALLSDLIKSQRESAEKTADAARTAVAAKEKAIQPGAIEVTIVHKADPVPVTIGLDDNPGEDFTGTVWSRRQVAPGLHTVHITTTAPPARTIQPVVDVPAGGIATAKVNLP